MLRFCLSYDRLRWAKEEEVLGKFRVKELACWFGGSNVLVAVSEFCEANS